MSAISSFSSIRHAVDELSHRFSSMPFSGEGIDPDTGERNRAPIRGFLFRGECGTWTETTSSMRRLKDKGFPIFKELKPEEQDAFVGAVEAISQHVASEVGKFLNISEPAAAGFVQHYELFTELIDFTSSLQNAIGFAVGNPGQWEGPRQVQIGVLDVARAAQSCAIVDIASMLQFARRPYWQRAYGLYASAFEDLKDRACCEAIGLQWFRIETEPMEALQYALLPDVLDAHSDPAAGLVQLILDDFAKSNHGWPDPLARFLAGRVAAAPFVAKVVSTRDGRPDEVELESALRAGLPFDEAKEREESRRLWSRDFPVAERARSY